jgi:hypothetical protein
MPLDTSSIFVGIATIYRVIFKRLGDQLEATKRLSFPSIPEFAL